ncbi:probable 28S ribosomal protein S6, mitochondrial [Amphibalanus amphitrite]|uniref:probable 28S ribosomal protein S6, mitochondrial n=1 Tax=Amphibalanus amphitrite TaxID=1232801 RepID=UPI001C9092FA|nr:probable 28S ribosomal protein S6, mitochondrial [Amphibalanus amphitrite]XP_043210980.1 probable 28S ribosomal protein S6, mitochondrial [Amphibalanus amphitrite]XP_043210981.1 probable 28S ribosomal protein S6, mitochondrial [Amphibalanus amphitrite]XP_043210982.1 probable 28S ribosomal protein S6, mitochondrial [Amphibalanus amphitrite]XP_043240574.1 probable 28S ribosomal protein S6, mitochondrial [Amphibalanus amphitrite]XP_043240575.1 probable 28S ribosomal protein S6, mitochondrial [
MPTYEISLLLRKMQKPALVQTVKRTAELVMDRGGYIRKVESLGTRALPSRMAAHGLRHSEGSYFRVEFDIPPARVFDVMDFAGRDVDVVRYGVFKVEEPEPQQCTFHEETMPPPYRAEVKQMLAAVEKKEQRQKKFKPNTKLDFYPFQR